MQKAYKIIAQDELTANAIDCAIASSIAAIGREAWNACYPNELEDYDYLLAMEEAGIPGFTWRYATVAENGRVLACMPAFLTDYSLATTLDGFPKRLVQSIQRRFPRFLVLKLACLGSPQTECGYAGFHPSVPDARKPELLRLLLTHFEREMTQLGFRLIGVKDVPEWQKPLWDEVALPMEFRPLPGMATSYLDIDFASIDDYLNHLSGETRKDMRRKLKTLPDIRIEHRARIDDVLPQIHWLYLDTKNRSDFEFEELPASYFSNVLRHMGSRAHCTLYYAGDELLAANLMLKNQHTLLDKFFCMDGAEGRKHHLYFISWFTNLHYCLEHGLKRYQSGQAGDASKRRLGSKSIPNWLLFKHANWVINGLLRLVSPLLAMD